MIAVDTNILIYAHRADSPFHLKADQCLDELVASQNAWCIPWPCLHEFLAIVTHPKIFSPPTALDDALIQVDCWMECPTLRLIGEVSDYWASLKDILQTSQIKGPQIHDARVAAICRKNGVDKIWTADRDFSRFKGLKTQNPL